MDEGNQCQENYKSEYGLSLNTNNIRNGKIAIEGKNGKITVIKYVLYIPLMQYNLLSEELLCDHEG